MQLRIKALYGKTISTIITILWVLEVVAVVSLGVASLVAIDGAINSFPFSADLQVMTLSQFTQLYCQQRRCVIRHTSHHMLSSSGCPSSHSKRFYFPWRFASHTETTEMLEIGEGQRCFTLSCEIISTFSFGMSEKKKPLFLTCLIITPSSFTVPLPRTSSLPRHG